MLHFKIFLSLISSFLLSSKSKSQFHFPLNMHFNACMEITVFKNPNNAIWISGLINTYMKLNDMTAALIKESDYQCVMRDGVMNN